MKGSAKGPARSPARDGGKKPPGKRPPQRPDKHPAKGPDQKKPDDKGLVKGRNPLHMVVGLAFWVGLALLIGSFITPW